ncbi:Rnase Y domain-containing protein [Myxococcota bacterium]|nr:Rnase Y domain-containing protein [Myxococcota bacterium]
MTVVPLLTGVAAAALAAAGFVVSARRRQRDRMGAAERDAASARARGLEGVARERTALVQEARRRADAIRAEARETARIVSDELDAEDQRLAAREAAIERHRAELDDRARELDAQFDALKVRLEAVQSGDAELPRIEAQSVEHVERAARQTRAETSAALAGQLTEQARLAAQKAARLHEEHARASAEVSARALIDLACQRYGAAVTTERLATTVTLPPAGKVRERLLADSSSLLRAITERTQTEFLAQIEGDELFLQAPDPYARELGRQTYERLVKERELNDAAVARVAAKAAADLEKTVRTAGRKAAEILKIEKMHPEILMLVGKLLYRTSYTQNQWAHAIETAYLCGMMAEDLKVDPVAARRAALIHDIGKVLYAETEAVGSHAVSGAAFARAHGEPPEIVHPIAAHHNDEKPDSVLAHIVAAADALSGARPGARRATEEAYSMRVEDLERICESFRGIESHFVIQGGRELRIVVDQARLSDRDAARLSEDVAGRIEEELTYPGQIKVTVIRETRAQAVARF